MTNRIILVFILGTVLGMNALPVLAQKMSADQMKQAAERELTVALTELVDFLKIPNNGRFPEQVDQNLKWCKRKFEGLGFDTRTLNTAGAPLLFAERVVNRQRPNVLFYLQIDGQPVDSTRWNQTNPYDAVLKSKDSNDWTIEPWSKLNSDVDRDWRIFARSASDSKGPAMAFMHALNILNELDVKPDYNIKVIMDFQEELGSPYLPAAVAKHKDLFKADMLFIMDGTRHLSNLPTLTFGARGIATVTLKVFGARRALHSGQYGNFSPNPVFKLSRLIAGMKDEQGRVLIPGFYDGVELTGQVKKSINSLPENLEEIKTSLGIAVPESVGGSYQEALQYPSLNVRGLSAAWVGKEVRTLIPADATAEIDMRLVPETPGERQVDLLRNYVESQGFHLVDSIPSEAERAVYENLASFRYRLGSRAFRTEFDSQAGKWLTAAMTKAFGPDGFVKMRTTGGSQPMAPFINTLGVPAVSIRIPNPDNSIHAPNENLRIGNFLEGIQMCLAVLTQEIKE
ncbi:MAG: dipeptidase [Roseivirga sp.]